MRKDARLSDQVTAGTGSRVAEGCLKTGSPASRSRAGFIELRFLAHFSIKETGGHLHFVGDDKTRVGQGLTLASELSKELPK
jgi:hypothetical protein